MSGARKPRLGKGLGALLGEDYMATPPATSAEVSSVPLSRIVPNPFQPRRDFKEGELEDLRASIRENGLLQPLVVRPAPGSKDRFELVAGERRFRAVSGLDWAEVAVVVRNVDDRALLVLALVENIQREALNPLEEAEGFQLLADDFGLTQGEIAEAVGRKRSTVANTLRLLRLPPSIRRYLEDGTLSMGHARALLSVEDPGRMVELGRRAATEGWSVRQVEARTRGGTPEGAARDPSVGEGGTGRDREGHSPITRTLQEALQEALGTRVKLTVRKEGRGTIEVPFSSNEDFERLFELLTGRDTSDVAG
jgi:ParB family transcriptional regulator, chromosome partitioning protein